MFGLITTLMPGGAGPAPRVLHLVASGITHDQNGYHLTISSRETPIFVHASPTNNTDQVVHFHLLDGDAISLIEPIDSITPGNITHIRLSDANLAHAFAHHGRNPLQILIQSEGIAMFLHLTFVLDEYVADMRYAPIGLIQVTTPLGQPARFNLFVNNLPPNVSLTPQLRLNGMIIPESDVRWGQAILLTQQSSGVSLNIHNNNNVYIPNALISHVQQTQTDFHLLFKVTVTYLPDTPMERTFMNFLHLTIRF